MGRIIVIEDNPVFRDHVCGMLEKAGYKTRTAYDCAGARRLLEELDDGDIIVSDLRLPDGECTEVLERMREAGIRNPFVIMTDYAQVASAVSSMRLGAEDYIPKTLLQEKLLPRISELVRKSERRHTMPILERRSAAFRTIDRRISLVAPTDIGVLILGENGTGKEHVAEKIHAQSTRQKGPFVAIDCGMLTRELAASELFGYEKGAFTGAITGKKGCMAEADGGTLFLDEVGNLAMETQQMLLRAIQERKYRPIGDKADKNFNIRIIAATNEDLEAAVNEKRFRQDLFYRLHDYEITVPPLRDCQEDIMPLAEFFREIANNELERNVKSFSASAQKALNTYAWPGNVRELRQKVLTAVLQAEDDMITEEDLEFGSKQIDSPVGFTLKSEGEEKERIRRALKQAKDNKRLAAELLGISRATLYKKLKEYGMNEEI